MPLTLVHSSEASPMRTRTLSLLPVILLLMSACATLPTGPGVLVLPHVGTPL
jgi:hypothetical protein